MTTHYLDTEHGYIINREYLRKIFDELTAEERQEYNNSFEDYISSCLIQNNGTLKPLTMEEYNSMINDIMAKY
jgi:hypothetical protein